MKVEFDEKGTMVVRSENTVESFALTHWFDLWRDKEAFFLVETVAMSSDRSKLEPHLAAVEPSDFQ